ncbi:MAG: DHA2 family efflux MFS transporter permease subunit [Proteobacteria bacterium]|nr:DHA2 family efflux MFS transporter permease subunit [Pseudomonadota bacterium]
MSARSNWAGRPPETRPFLITCMVMLPTIMHSVDITIVAVAVPAIQGAMGATEDEVAWVLSSYLIAVAVITPATGWLSSALGRRRLLLLSVAGFTFASLLCGIADSLNEIVVFRILQGGFGATLIPLSQAIVLDTYPVRDHGRAMAFWGVGVMAGPIMGPVLGGLITDLYSWRWVFFINLPIGLAAMAGVLLIVPESETARKRRLDWIGFATLALGLAALQMILDRGEKLEWFASTEIGILALVAGIALYLFLLRSLSSTDAFLDLRLFGNRNFAICLCLGFSAHACLYSTIALLPPMLQNVLGYPAFTAGLLFIPRAVGTLVGMFVVSQIARHIDMRISIAAGLLIAAFGIWQMAGFSTEVGSHEIIVTGLTQGFGLGLAFTPITVLAFSTLARESRTEAAGVYAILRSFGASIGISAFVTLYARNVQINRSALVEQISPYNEAMTGSTLPQAWSLDQAAGLSSLSREIDRQAAMIAYVDDFALIALCTALLVPLVFLLRPPAKGPAPKRPDPPE